MTVQVDFSKLDLQDALDLAVLIEKEAEERYRWFVDLLGERYPGDAADFFAMMARNEKRHGDELAKRRHALFGDAPSRVTAEMIEDIEAPGSGTPRPFMSPRHALEVAMESEIKAYEFFDQALPGVKDPAVRRAVRGSPRRGSHASGAAREAKGQISRHDGAGCGLRRTSIPPRCRYRDRQA